MKIQVEFNPKAVAGYRLIGYENRMLRHEDFNDDKKDAGEIGAGHSVTALYEIVPAGVAMEGADVDPLKYQTPSASSARTGSDELLTVKLRYKAPDADDSRLISTTVKSRPEALTANLGFASAVAEVGMLLRRRRTRGPRAIRRRSRGRASSARTIRTAIEPSSSGSSNSRPACSVWTPRRGSSPVASAAGSARQWQF